MIVRNFDSTDPIKLENCSHDMLVMAYMIVHVMESKLWKAKHDMDAWDNPEMIAETNRINDRLKTLGQLYFKRFRDRCHYVNYNGYLTDEFHSHYDIDEDLKDRFGSDISVDSESGQFWASSNEKVKDQVKEFLQTKYPLLDFEITVHDNVNEPLVESYHRPRIIGGWNYSKKWLAEREVKVDYTHPSPSPKKGKDLDKLINEVRSIIKKTGLTKEEVISLL
jgi:hypothetical protein